MYKYGKTLIQKYFEEQSFVDSDIDSFNNFIDKELLNIIEENKEIVPTIIPHNIDEFKIRLDKIWVEKPKMTEADGSIRNIYPMEARLRKITYSAPTWITVSEHINGVQRESLDTQIGNLPIMLKSKWCHLHKLGRDELISKGEDPDEPGGYFIINGTEKVLITIEDLAPNRFLLERDSTGPSEVVGKLFSEYGSFKIPHTLEKMKDGLFYLTFTRVKRIPVIVLVKALGLLKDEEITKSISQERQFDEVIINLLEFVSIKTEEEALDYIAKKIGITQSKEVRIERVVEILDKYLLPHLGIRQEDRIYKAYNLCKILKKYILAMNNELEIDDKDHYLNKRLKMSGDLLADLIRLNLKVLIGDLLYNFQRIVKRGKFPSIKNIIRDKLLTQRIYSSMATGVWVGGRKGISQRIQRLNYLETLSHLQRVVSPLSASQENFAARELHPTHLGRLCIGKKSNILLADGKTTRTLEQLQNCWKHHDIMTYDTFAKNFRPSKISRYFMSNPKLMGKSVFKVISEAGREIIATGDHPFLTPNGWVNASELANGDFVAVLPMLTDIKTPEPPSVEKGKVVVDENIIRRLFPHRFKQYIKELRLRELLPFNINNYWAEIIARLQGHLFTDGHCGKNNLEFYCGSLSDAEEIANDIRQLKFEPSRIDKKISKANINERTVTYTTYRLTKGGALHSLLVALGTPIGKKTDTGYTIPGWLKDAEASVKREFLAAYMGGDGSKPRFIIGRNAVIGKAHIDDLFFHKNFMLKDAGMNFASELAALFGQFNVKIKRIDILDGYERKDRSKTVKIGLVFSKSTENIKNLITTIGYRYCKMKGDSALYLGEWLRMHNKVINDKIMLKRKIKSLHNTGRTPKEIAKLVNASYRMINSCLFERKYEKTGVARSGLMPFDEWFKIAKGNLDETDLIWQRINDKLEADLDDVRDLTTQEDTHTFIANGFVTHNCPIETPEGTNIGLRKNLALLCTISGNSNEEDILKSLKGIGLKVIK